MTFNWTDNPTVSGIAQCDTDVLNDCLMHLKYDNFSSTFNILDFKWADHTLNDLSWLNPDAFSWQDGTVYVQAYNHLVADIEGKTAQTETVSGYTVTFYLADDGHKICLADQNTIIANIYTATGSAWYYMLDTDNRKFKLPRATVSSLYDKKLYFYVGEHTQSAIEQTAGLNSELLNQKVDKTNCVEVYPVIQKYQSGTSWYRIYSDGWCEQGGLVSGTSVVFLKTFNSLPNVSVGITTLSGTSSFNYNTAKGYFGNTLTASGFQCSNFGQYWVARGYLAEGQY